MSLVGWAYQYSNSILGIRIAYPFKGFVMAGFLYVGKAG
jgi:hypothetical protein